jgi:hypothetical protein
MRHLLIFVAALSCAAEGWPILRAAKGGGAIRLGESARTRRVAHPSRSEGWGRHSFGWKGEDSAMCGGGY